MANITLKYMIYVPDSLLLHSVREDTHCLVHHGGACGSGRGVKMASHSPPQIFRVRMSGFGTFTMYSMILSYCCTSDYTPLSEEPLENNEMGRIRKR